MLDMPGTRRRFILATGCAALGARLAGGAAEGASPDQPIVDTHQHLWDLSKLRLPWLDGAPELKRDFLLGDYRAAAAGLSIVKAVYMEVAVEPSQQRAEAEAIVELCRRGDGPTCAAVIGGDPAAESFKGHVERFKDSKYVKGVRQILSGPAGRATSKEFVRGVKLLGDLGMSFDLCMAPGLLPEGLALVRRCPDTRFIVDHCGNADPKAFRKPGGAAAAEQKPSHDPEAWRRAMAELAGCPNTVCKISGIVAQAPKDSWTAGDLAPIVDHCLASFGPDRVMFGSDWPVCARVATLKQWVDALKEIVRGRSARERRLLFHDNAVRFYGLG